jgi:hypothetical protein
MPSHHFLIFPKVAPTIFNGDLAVTQTYNTFFPIRTRYHLLSTFFPFPFRASYLFHWLISDCNRLTQTTQTLQSSAATMSWDVGAGSGGDWSSGGGGGGNSFNEPATGGFNNTATGDTRGYGGNEGADTFVGGSGRQNDGACFNCGEQGYVF